MYPKYCSLTTAHCLGYNNFGGLRESGPSLLHEMQILTIYTWPENIEQIHLTVRIHSFLSYAGYRHCWCNDSKKIIYGTLWAWGCGDSYFKSTSRWYDDVACTIHVYCTVLLQIINDSKVLWKFCIAFKPLDQNLNSHLLPLHISYRTSQEKLLKYQAN